MEYTLEAAKRLAEELRAIPPKDPSKRRLDKQGMVKELTDEIVALQQRGYTIEEVAESLRERGLGITTPTLKNYLQRVKRAGASARKPRRPAASPRTRAETNGSAVSRSVPERTLSESGSKVAATSVKAEAPPTPPIEPALRSGKSAFLIKDKESY
jgi:hypothetical protein